MQPGSAQVPLLLLEGSGLLLLHLSVKRALVNLFAGIGRRRRSGRWSPQFSVNHRKPPARERQLRFRACNFIHRKRNCHIRAPRHAREPQEHYRRSRTPIIRLLASATRARRSSSARRIVRENLYAERQSRRNKRSATGTRRELSNHSSTQRPAVRHHVTGGMFEKGESTSVPISLPSWRDIVAQHSCSLPLELVYLSSFKFLAALPPSSCV